MDTQDKNWHKHVNRQGTNTLELNTGIMAHWHGDTGKCTLPQVHENTHTLKIKSMNSAFWVLSSMYELFHECEG